MYNQSGYQVLASSEGLGWDHLLLEQHWARPMEMDKPALAEHFICLNMEAEWDLWQARDGKTQQQRQPPGSLTLMPAGQESHWQWRTTAAALLLLIQPSFVVQAAGQMGLGAFEIVGSFGVSDARLLHLGLALRNEAQSGGSRPLFADTLSMAFAVHLLTHYSSRLPKQTQTPGLTAADVERVQDYVRDNLGGSLSLAEVAGVVHVSPFHFARLWRRATGTSLHEFVTQCRVEAAAALLTRGTLSAGQIAAEVGFAQQSHLATHFRRGMGLSPAEYRRQARR